MLKNKTGKETTVGLQEINPTKTMSVLGVEFEFSYDIPYGLKFERVVAE